MPGLKNSMSPLPSSLSAPISSSTTRVPTAGDLEGDPGRHVPLDQAGDDVDDGLLRREDQVHADRARVLGQADDVLLHLLAAVIIRSAISSTTMTM